MQTWKSIPEGDKPKLLAASGAVEKRLQEAVPKQDADAIAAMTKQGLKVTKPSGAEWRTQIDNLTRTMRGGQVPPDIFDLAVKLRDEFRKQSKPAR
jgi:TRAP-type C4-dicarboxylate transport system substrate-binding protein